MLTPAFDLHQDSNFLTVTIKAPFAKVSETEVFVEENDFKFYSKPYFLRLTLPGNIVEDSREKGDYDAEKGVFTLKFPKQSPGEHFEGLDMITQLLAPRGSTVAAPPMIEVIDDCPTEPGCCHGDKSAEEEEEFDWSIEQTPYEEETHPLDAPKYGFANQKSGIFSRLQEELGGIVDVPDPDTLPMADRRRLRLEAEHAKFDEDHYISDLYEDDIIQPLLQYDAPWLAELERVKSGSTVEVAVELTDEEKDTMRRLPRREYLLDEVEEKRAYLGLVDVIYAFAYNHRITEGENTVESGWTVGKISATLSWLEVFSSVKDVAVSAFRRCLCYPLFRHWQLNMTVWNDVKHIFQLGRRRLLKCLLEVRGILTDQDSRYVLNDLYITDYCVWIQSASEKKISSIFDAISKVTISKADVDLDVPEVERLAAVSLEDDGIETVTHSLAHMSVAQQVTGAGRDTHSDDVSTGTDDGSTETDDSSTETDDSSTDNDDENKDTADVITDNGNTACSGTKCVSDSTCSRLESHQNQQTNSESPGNPAADTIETAVHSGVPKAVTCLNGTKDDYIEPT